MTAATIAACPLALAVHLAGLALEAVARDGARPEAIDATRGRLALARALLDRAAAEVEAGRVAFLAPRDALPPELRRTLAAWRLAAAPAPRAPLRVVGGDDGRARRRRPCAT